MYNQKETGLLNDMKKEEALCMEKYRQYAQNAKSPLLKDLMNKLGNEEAEHFNSIEKLLSGNIPPLPPKVPESKVGKEVKEFTSRDINYNSDSNAFMSDKYLCSDALGTEKHVSSMYDTSIFEFKNSDVRNVLNHIQKEEQLHGLKLYNYMAENGMYN